MYFPCLLCETINRKQSLQSVFFSNVIYSHFKHMIPFLLPVNKSVPIITWLLYLFTYSCVPQYCLAPNRSCSIQNCYLLIWLVSSCKPHASLGLSSHLRVSSWMDCGVDVQNEIRRNFCWQNIDWSSPYTDIQSHSLVTLVQQFETDSQRCMIFNCRPLNQNPCSAFQLWLFYDPCPELVRD